uniref:4-nitrophenylphosphatase n=1 Tax=Blastobotrys adeninivorans TaxID=409370 RepID=A0A060T2T1_BLAAD
MSQKITSKKEVEEFLDKYDHFLFDCDGVLWRGNHLLPSVVETLDLLRSKNKQLTFVTNNSTKSRRAYTEKFAKFGLSVSASEIFGSSYSAAVYLKKVVQLPEDKKVLVIGESGIEEELQAAGVNYVGGTDPNLRQYPTEELLAQVERDPSIGAVLVGLDLHINYLKISHGMVNLMDKDTLFLATNTDSTFPSKGKMLPGAGTVVGTLETCTGRKPTALGKPSPAMMDCIKAEKEIVPERTCMIGDRLNTDIMFGRQGGLGTLMVLTGVDKEETILSGNAIAQPDFYIDKLGSIYEYASQ